MPWTPAEAKTHKGDLTDKEAQTWARIANEAHARCIKGGESAKVCDGRAIRIASAAINQARKAIGDGQGVDGPRQGVGGTDVCTCPKCDYETKHERGVPCAEVKCPKCGATLEGKSEKASIENNVTNNLIHGSGGVLNPLRGGATKCVCPKCGHEVEHKKGIPCGKCPKCGTVMKQGKEDKEVSDKAQEPLSKLTVYKSGDVWRWLAVSNTAIEDREGEVITEKAYDDAIVWAFGDGKPGELDLVHVNGTDVGKCDMMLRLGGQLVEGGTFQDDERAKRVRESIREDPDYWGISIKFRYDPDQFDGRVYHGGIRIIKRSVLPRHMAASYGTAIAVTGGNEMKMIDEETRAALSKLGYSDDEIAVLAEKQKSVVDEPNVKVKEETFLQGVKEVVAKTLGEWFSKEETAEPAVAERPEADKEVAPEKETQPDLAEAFKAYTEMIVKAFAEQLAPFKIAIEEQNKHLSEMEKRLAETEKDIETKVSARLAELPPVVKVRASDVAATVTEEGGVGLVPIEGVQTKTAIQKLMSDIATEVAHKVASGQYEV